MIGPRRVPVPLVVALALLGPFPAFAGNALPAGAAKLDAAQRTKLHDALQNADEYKVRLEAAIILGRRGDAKDDLDVLSHALAADDNYMVRGAAAIAIGDLGDPAGIEPLLGAMEDSEAFVRHAAAENVRKLRSPKAVPYLALANQKEDASVRALAVEVLGKIDRPEARKALAEFLGDSSQEVQAQVQKTLASWNREQTVQVLLAALSNPSYKVRAAAARLCAKFPDPRFIPPLSNLLAALLEEPRVQVAAASSLEQLKSLLDTEDLVKRVQGLVDHDARVKAIILLGIKGGPRAVQVLTRTLKDPDVGIRGYAVMSLGRAGDRSAVPALKKLETDPKNKRIDGVIHAALRDLGSVTSRD